MKLTILAVGQKQPQWMTQGFEDYSRRMPKSCSMYLQGLTLAPRNKGWNTERLQQHEASKFEKHIQPGSHVIALDERGQQWSSLQWSEKFTQWMQLYPQVYFLIGGPDGLYPPLRKSADECLSLGKITLPHGLARIVLAEQLYRAWSLMSGHPYHRE